MSEIRPVVRLGPTLRNANDFRVSAVSRVSPLDAARGDPELVEGAPVCAESEAAAVAAAAASRTPRARSRRGMRERLQCREKIERENRNLPIAGTWRANACDPVRQPDATLRLCSGSP